MPAVILATGLLLACTAVAFRRPSTLAHHLRVFVLRHTAHAGRHVLETLAVSGADPGEEIDVTSQLDAAVQVAGEHRLLLLLAHLPLVEIRPLVRLEPLAVLRLHQRHAELVQPVALAHLIGVEHGRARHIGVRLVYRHVLLRLLAIILRRGLSRDAIRNLADRHAAVPPPARRAGNRFPLAPLSLTRRVAATSMPHPLRGTKRLWSLQQRERGDGTRRTVAANVSVFRDLLSCYHPPAQWLPTNR